MAWQRVMLPVREISPPSPAFSSRTGSTGSPAMILVRSQAGSVRVEETTIFSIVFSSWVMPVRSSSWSGQ